jgi:hypothetical protein
MGRSGKHHSGRLETGAGRNESIAGLVLFFSCNVNRRFVGGLLFFLALDAILKTFDGLAQVGTHIADFFGAKHQHDDNQHDQPVPNTERTHFFLLVGQTPDPAKSTHR